MNAKIFWCSGCLAKIIQISTYYVIFLNMIVVSEIRRKKKDPQ